MLWPIEIIGIKKGDKFALYLAQSPIARCRFTAIGLLNQPDTRVPEAFNDGRRAIG